jgi:CHAT domain-containing protein
LPDGKYAVERYGISYLTSGHHLLAGPVSRVKVREPVVLADPDFDLDPARARAEARRLLVAREDDSMRTRSGVPGMGPVRRLPGAASEAKAIAPRLQAFTGVRPRVYTGAEALEAVFKAARNPRVAVLCTHGFVRPNQQAGPGESALGQNPLLRCGLLLAGCNKADMATSGDDGVLTGLEVLGCDLRGCELVVLSACQTGLGDVQTGEGVAGLRQAFQLTGAQAVVGTLWNVPDGPSARLMALFFDNLSRRKSKPEALRLAQLKMIEERREEHAGAHPFIWGAFTLTGR